MTNKPISRKSNIVVQDMQDEVLIYDLTINKAFCLNQTSGLVYALCDGAQTVAEISDEMSKQLQKLVSEDFVYLASEELRENNLLENSEEVPDHFAGMSRREVVKKVGLASMVALPVIASVVAPNAAMAQSNVCSTCVTAVCIPTGQDLCLGCVGCRINFNLYDAGSTCTSLQGMAFTDCTSPLSGALFDAQLTSFEPIP